MPKENLKSLYDSNDSSQIETTTLVDNTFGNTCDFCLVITMNVNKSNT